MNKPCFYFTLLISCMLCISHTARASHCAGGEIAYQWLHDSTYSIIVKFYRDCSGNGEPAYVDLCYNNTCNNDGGTVRLNKTLILGDGKPNGFEVTIGCSGFPSRCMSTTSNLPGYREWWYSGQVTLTSKCDYWRFFTSFYARNPSSNLNSFTAWLYLEATLDNLDAPTNSSPVFTTKPVPYVCLNQPFTYNNGVTDIDKDDLVFSPSLPQDQSGSCSNPPGNYSIGFSAKSPPLALPDNPFQTNKTYRLDKFTGNLSFTPGELGPQAVSFLTEEYRNGKLIGTVTRDVQIQVMTCSLSPLNLSVPSPQLVNAAYINGTIEACKGTQLSFCFDVVAATKGTVIAIQDNHGSAIPGSTLTYTNVKKDSVRGCFSWSPPPTDTGLKVLTITVKDSTCRPPGILVPVSYTIPIHFNSSADAPKVISPVYRCLNSPPQPLTANGSNLKWYDSATGGTASAVAPSPHTDTVGSTVYYVSATPNGCESNRVPIEVIVTAIDASIVLPKDTICQYEAMRIAHHGTHIPGFQYSWYGDTGKIRSYDTTGSVVSSWYTPGLKKIILHMVDSTCVANDSAYLYVKPTPIPDFELPGAGCVGHEIIMRPKNADASYHWDITEQDITDTLFVPQYTFVWQTPGVKTAVLRLNAFNGCNMPPDTSKITMYDNPIAKITIGGDGRICYNQKLTLQTPEGQGTPNWWPAEYFDHYNWPQVNMEMKQDALVALGVTNKWGCTSADTMYLAGSLCCTVLMPDAFTPNGDGHNDIYHPIGLENHSVGTFIVMNRWGQIIFSTNDPAAGWDGRFKSSDQQIGTYYYYIKYRCRLGGVFEKKGSFELIR